MDACDIAIVGAEGLVGQELLKILEERRFPVASLRLFDSERNRSSEFFFSHQRIDVEEISVDSFRGIDVAFFCDGADASRRLLPAAVQAGTIVVDHSGLSVSDQSVPMVVPEVNAEDIARHKGVLGNPGCSTIELAVVLYPLHKVNAIKRIVVSTYESVSSSGTSTALKELTAQAKRVLEGRRVCPHLYSHQIAFNVLPEIDVFLDNGYTKGEWRLIQETRRILGDESIGVSATCVRVPVYFGQCQAVNVEFDSAIMPEEARRVLAEAPGVRILDDPSVSFYPQPWSASGLNHVFVGRIRRDLSRSNALSMWIVCDNLRKGAALNAVQIVEEGLRRDWIRSKKRRT
ncbi:MAG: aspartate-semialdehyde dehydrogenase [Dehalococcoidia bacterium]|nr:aspartate-semialdehyde dehydrogenase [Dehalococcoidia bacterium]